MSTDSDKPRRVRITAPDNLRRDQIGTIVHDKFGYVVRFDDGEERWFGGQSLEEIK